MDACTPAKSLFLLWPPGPQQHFDPKHSLSPFWESLHPQMRQTHPIATVTHINAICMYICMTHLFPFDSSTCLACCIRIMSHFRKLCLHKIAKRRLHVIRDSNRLESATPSEQNNTSYQCNALPWTQLVEERPHDFDCSSANLFTHTYVNGSTKVISMLSLPQPLCCPFQRGKSCL